MASRGARAEGPVPLEERPCPGAHCFTVIWGNVSADSVSVRQHIKLQATFGSLGTAAEAPYPVYLCVHRSETSGALVPD